MRVSIDHPTNRPNYSIVHIGDLHLAFSYQTLIGVSETYGRWTLIRNYWGPTTGKHLNDLDPTNHENRLTAEEFAEFVDSLGLEVSI